MKTDHKFSVLNATLFKSLIETEKKNGETWFEPSLTELKQVFDSIQDVR